MRTRQIRMQFIRIFLYTIVNRCNMIRHHYDEYVILLCWFNFRMTEIISVCKTLYKTLKLFTLGFGYRDNGQLKLLKSLG